MQVSPAKRQEENYTSSYLKGLKKQKAKYFKNLVSDAVSDAVSDGGYLKK